MKRILGSKFSANLYSKYVQINDKDKILVLPVCTMPVYVDDKDSWLKYYGKKGALYQKIVNELQMLGASLENVCVFNYIEDEANKNIDIDLYNYVIIPGGDAELGIRRLRDLNLIDDIINYTGDIIAYSAGALMLFEKFFLSPNWYYKEMKYATGLKLPGMPDCIIEVHYDYSDGMRTNVLEAIKHIRRDCILIGDEGVVCYDPQTFKLYFNGDVSFEKYLAE